MGVFLILVCWLYILWICHLVRPELKFGLNNFSLSPFGTQTAYSEMLIVRTATLIQSIMLSGHGYALCLCPIIEVCMSIVVVAFYKFFAFPDYQQWREPLKTLCDEHGIKGTILLAHEGMNATIAGSRDGIDAVLNSLCDDPRLADLTWKESYTDVAPFARMKVRLKKEIVTLGVDGIDPTRHVGIYVAPDAWNEVISDPDVVVIDTRNEYEVQVGTFRNALNPHTDSFREFPAFVRDNLDPAKQPKVAMFCTGGIRCEKATAFMLQQGFKQVYHLQGGILQYLEDVQPDQSLWEGECYVFDERVTVDHGLQRGSYTLDLPTGLPKSKDSEHVS